LGDKLIEYTIVIRLAVKKIVDKDSFEGIITARNDMVRAAFALDSVKLEVPDTYNSDVNDLECYVNAYIAAINHAFRTRGVTE